MRHLRYWQVQKRELQFVVYRTDSGNPECQSIMEKKGIAMTSLTPMLEEMCVYKGPEDVKGNTGLFLIVKMLQIPTNAHTFLTLAFKMLIISTNMHTFFNSRKPLTLQ